MSGTPKRDLLFLFEDRLFEVLLLTTPACDIFLENLLLGIYKYSLEFNYNKIEF